MVLVSVVSLMVLSGGNFTLYGIMLPEYIHYFEVSRAEASIVSSISISCSGIVGEYFILSKCEYRKKKGKCD